MKRAIITIAPEAVRQILKLPEGAIFEEMRIPFGQPGVIEVKVSGVGWETPEGSHICMTEAATVEVGEDGEVINIDWKLP